MTEINESRINIVSEGSHIEGHVTFNEITRVHGVITGKVESTDGSTVILGETGVIEGEIRADNLVVDGFIRGDIFARKRVMISRTGRVLGNICTPSLRLEFGCYFEGQCSMEKLGRPDAAAEAPIS